MVTAGGDGRAEASAPARDEPLDARERRLLCDRLEALGPQAPTLCEGWTTDDLAAHLVLREHFRRWDDAARSREKAKGFASLVAELRAGPTQPPWTVPVVRTYLNGFEYFVHHEDVRRANGGEPRPVTPDLERLCWQVSFFLGLRLARALRPFALELVAPGRRRHFGRGEAVVLTGSPPELALYLAGRRAAARVEATGPAAGLDALGRAATRL